MSMTPEEAIEWFENHMPTKIMPVAKAATVCFRVRDSY